MRIAVIGAGQVGSAVGTGWARAGHRIVYGVRDPADPRHARLLAGSGAEATRPARAAAGAELVLLALPWAEAEPVVKGLGVLAGRIVLDAMNPLAMGPNGLGLDRGFSTSGGETVAGWLPGARVVKTLNTVGAEVMAGTSGFPAPPVMFMAGDDAAAKATTADLLEALGFAPQDAGPLRNARLLEPMAMLWINQALFQGQGRGWAFAALRRA